MAETAQTGKTRFPIGLIIVYVAALASLLAWPFIGFMSVFAFDAPGSAQDPKVWTIVIVLLSYPVLPVAGVIASVIARLRRAARLSWVLAGVASLPTVIFLALLAAIYVSSLSVMMGVR